MSNATYVYDGWKQPIELAAGPRERTAAVTLPWSGKSGEIKVILNAAQARTLANLFAAVATGLEKKG